MADIALLGYTASRIETAVTAEIVKYVDKCEKGMAVKCGIFIPDDCSHSVLRIRISMGAYISDPESKPFEDRTPFSVFEGDFMFSFNVEGCSEISEIKTMTKTTGLQIAIPILRGVIVGICDMLNMPAVFSFPMFRAEEVEWEGEEASDD